MTTPARATFEAFYQDGTPPWVIGAPQPAIVALEQTGVIHGKVLDPGCGLGEHTILLTRLGYEVLGVDKTATAEQLKRGYLKKALLWVGGTMSRGRAWRCRESRARRWW